MATTLNLPYDRFVSQVTIGEPRPKANYLLMMAENLASLQRCEWTPAQNGSVVELPPHDFTRETFFADSYDAFKMGAAYDATNLTETAFAGMAAYRLKLPAAYLSGAQTLVSIEIPVQRDRALKSGLRIAAELSDSTTPSTDWAVVRGESGDLAEEAILSQSTVERYVDGRAAQDSVTISLTGADSTKRAYLWVYVTLEDYEDRWTRYNAKEARNYAIEGSAMISGDLAAVTFSADVAADESDSELMLAEHFFDKGGLDGTKYIYPIAPRYARRVTATVHFNLITGSYASSPMASTLAVRRAYGAFAQGGGVTELVPAEGVETETGLSAYLARGQFKLTSVSDDPYNAITATIVSQPFVISFATPKGWRPTRLSVRHSTWNPPVDYTSTDERGVLHLWLARGVFLQSYPQSLIADFRFYRPDVGSPPGWELVGTINRDILVATTTGGQRNMIFPLKAPLGGTVATLMAVPYVDMSAWTPPVDVFGRTDGQINTEGEYSVIGASSPGTLLDRISLL